MRTYHAALAVLLTLWVGIGCSDDEPSSTQPPTDDTGQSATKTYSSRSGGSFAVASGHGLNIIAGSVPPGANGQSASVTFSVETNLTPPKPIPPAATVKGSIVKFGPDGFDFQWPVDVRMKLPDDVDPSTVSIIHYSPELDRWIAVAGSGANSTEHTMTAGRLSLGYYAVAQLSPMTKSNLSSAWGGFVYNNPEVGKWYTLTPASITNWVYPWQQQWLEAEAMANTGHTGTSIIGGAASETYILLPQASYQIWVSVTDGSGVFYTYSIPMSGSIAQEVTYGTPPGGTGWTPIGPLESGGTWVQGLPTGGTAGLPALWPSPTVTFGTGAFQATLTWVNNSSHATDLDLHLYGPNDMHVYYNSKASADSSFQLDRDWLSSQGNATENIYSTRTSLPAGSYRVTVKHYSGDPTSYNVRILRGGTVRSYSGSASGNTETEIAAFSLP